MLKIIEEAMKIIVGAGRDSFSADDPTPAHRLASILQENCRGLLWHAVLMP
jgi:hypothetical protein